MFMQERPDVVALVCVSALLECTEDTLSRGDEFPFKLGNIRTNGLTTAAAYVLDIASAKATATKTMTCGEARDFVQEGSYAWHTYSIFRLIDAWPGKVHDAYAHSKNMAAHAALAGCELLAENAAGLARACFTLSCDRLLDPPSRSMKDLVFAACTGEIPDDLCATLFTDKADSECNDLVSEVRSSFPRLIDTEVRRMTLALKARTRSSVKNKCVALCILLKAHEGLEFDV